MLAAWRRRERGPVGDRGLAVPGDLGAGRRSPARGCWPGPGCLWRPPCPKGWPAIWSRWSWTRGAQVMVVEVDRAVAGRAELAAFIADALEQAGTVPAGVVAHLNR